MRHRRSPLVVFLVLGALIVGLVLLPLPNRAASSPTPPQIRLRYATFDPLEEEPPLPAGQRLSVQADRPATYLVQFTGPVRDVWKRQVERVGARLYGYIPDHAFLARMTPAVAEQVRSLPFVRWVGLYHPAYRLAEELQGVGSKLQVARGKLQVARGKLQGAGGKGQGAGDEVITVTVQTLPDVALDALEGAIEGLGGKVLGRGANAIAGYFRVSIAPDRLEALAALDGVLWVEPYFEPELYNDVGGGQIMRANDVRSSLSLYGAGQIVAVADTGLDVGTTGSAMSDDFEGRIVGGQAICALFQGGRTTWNDFDGHGTHVAGSVLGNGVLSGSDPSQHNYGSSFAGVAPEAQLVFQSIDNAPGNGLECVPSDLVNYLFKLAYDKGARVHTNSWGGPTGGTSQNPEYGGYDSQAQQADAMMWQYKDMLILYAAGNSGVDADADGVVDLDAIGSPGTAKNVVTVGASENLRSTLTTRWGDGWPSDFPVDPIFSDQIADDSDGMAAFSSRGPTDDGRIKPDLVAPGTFIISARSHDPQAGTGWGVYNEHYLYMGGTSMATPLTAGAAAIVREWLTRIKGVTNPSAALMKAVLVNGTADMTPGQYGTGSTQEIPSQRPNNVAGWGRVDLVESLNPPSPRKVWLKDNTTGLSTGGAAVYTLTVGTTQTTGRQAPLSVATSGPSRAMGSAQPAVRSLDQAPPFVGEAGFRPAGTSQVLQNSGFETGSWSPWQTYGWPYLTDVVTHTGSWSAHLGNADNANDQFWQQVGIPADATAVTIDFWYRMLTDEIWTSVDYFCYSIWDQTGTTVYVQRCADFGQIGNQDWTREVYSLSATELASVVGQTVLFGFFVQTDGSLSSRAWVDDTALYVTTPDATPTPTPTSTPTTTLTGGPFRITLAWTDYPGQPSAAKALVNDLDLEVIAPDGTHYYGNQGLYTTGQCLRSGKWDACNNVEGIIIPNALYGTYTVIVHGYSVPQGPQPFALVASGDNLKEGSWPIPNLQPQLYLPLVVKE